MPINFLTGDHRLRSIRDSAKEYARSAYDPDIYAPSIDVARTTAAEGIGVEREAENIIGRMMTGGIDQRRVEASGTAGRAMGVGLAADEAAMGAVTDVYTQMQMADEQVRRAARGQLGELQTAARGMGARRDAAIHEADMMYGAERGRRRQALAGTAISALAGPIGGAIAGRIFGGGGEAPGPARLEYFDDEIVEADVDMGLDLGFDMEPFDLPSAVDTDPDTDTGVDLEFNGNLPFFPGALRQRQSTPEAFPEDEIVDVDLSEMYRQHVERTGREMAGLDFEEYPWDTPGGWSGLRESFRQLWRQISPSEEELMRRFEQRR